MYNPVSNLGTKLAYLKAQEGFRRAPLLAALRLISWHVRPLLCRPVVTTLHRWQVQMALPADWRGVGKLIFAFREWYEPELVYLEKILSRGKVFVDVGANLGIYTLVASKIVGETGRVVAFEPSAQSFPALRKNVALNALTNVLAFPLALAHKPGKAKLYRGPNPSLNSLGMDPSWKEEAEEITTDSLDRVLHRASIDWVDVIKLDVQGAEELVLRGASNVLTSMRPVIIFEVFPEGTAPLALSPYGAWELLHSAGYEFFIVNGEAAYRAKSPPSFGNVVAIHRQRR